MQFERGDRYSRGAIAFHWVIAALVLFNLWLGLFHDALPREWKVMPVHKSVGITVLVLTLGRIAWRLAHKPPHLPDHMAGWEKALAKGVHFVLYALLLIMPLTGWIFSSNPERLRPFSWFFVFDIPLLPVSSAMAVTAKDAHEILGWTMAILVLLHILGALRHHFLLRDRVLSRMLPWAKRNG
ncbi:MAG: cytochrome b [Sphingomonadales bacterium]|nr:MAG: cytochrome b [Sphingomonadales bacterium]